jgi:hypothetical protein
VPVRKRSAPLAVVVLLASLVLSTACGGSSGDEYVDDSADTPTPDPVASGTPATASDIAGHWFSSDYGDAYIQLSGGRAKVVYGKDGGRVSGALHGGTIVGWWTEPPTRKPGDDAGDIQITFVRSGGKLIAEGKWRNGTTGDYEADWNLSKVDNTIPTDVRTVFADQSQFVTHP